MQFIYRYIIIMAILLVPAGVFAETSINQTDTTSPILPQDSLPFDVSIELASFSLPNGFHSGVFAIYKGKWLILAGRTNGMHGFGPGIGNFPPSKQNTDVFVIDPKKGTVYTRSLSDPTSGLNQQQIDLLSVTSPQWYYTESTMYMCGGYGVDTATGQFSTKPVLTAIDLSGFVSWVLNATPNGAVKNIRQITHPLVQVTGGYMDSADPHLFTLLIFGQNFQGLYTSNSNGVYTEQVRCFQIVDNAGDLYIQPRKMENPNPNYRRRDLNVLPVIHNNKEAFVALSGVFTEAGGVWTVPVFINTDGTTKMANPASPGAFKQGMNNYISGRAGLYSSSTKNMYMLLLGGISYGFFTNGVFEVDSNIPFINEVTTVKLDKKGNYTQYLMNAQFPVMISTGSNPGNPLLFGAGSNFIPTTNVSRFSNEVVQFDKLKGPTVIGYVVGGIMSTLGNTNDQADSTGSPYIFQVVVTPK